MLMTNQHAEQSQGWAHYALAAHLGQNCPACTAMQLVHSLILEQQVCWSVNTRFSQFGNRVFMQLDCIVNKTAHRGAKGWQQHHDHMAPARQAQQAQRAQRLAQLAVPKHLEQHKSAPTHHQNLPNLAACHAKTAVLKVFTAEYG